MPKFQGKVQIFCNLHSLSETFAPCAPKGLAPNAHACYSMNNTSTHTVTYRER